MNRKPTLADYKRAMRQYARELRRWRWTHTRCPSMVMSYSAPARLLHHPRKDAGRPATLCGAATLLRSRGYSNAQIADAFERAAK